jgi:hypothetical protein
MTKTCFGIAAMTLMFCSLSLASTAFVGVANATSTGPGNGTCLMALERNPKVNIARHYPGSSADFTEIVSSKLVDKELRVQWRTSVFMPDGSTKTVLKGVCLTSANGSKLLQLSFEK